MTKSQSMMAQSMPADMWLEIAFLKTRTRTLTTMSSGLRKVMAPSPPKSGQVNFLEKFR